MSQTTPPKAATRVPVRCPVEILVGPLETRFVGTLHDVSRTGLFLLLPMDVAAAFETGQLPAKVSFTPGPKQLIEAAGVVREASNTRDHKGQPQLGVSIDFVDLPRRTEESLRRFISQWRPTVLLVGFDAVSSPEMHAQLAVLAKVLWASSAADVLRYFDAYDVALLCVGPQIVGAAARDVAQHAPLQRPEDSLDGAGGVAARVGVDRGRLATVGVGE